jgi:type IV pilus assembly protein PilC
MKFSYKALDKDSNTIEGTQSAEDEAALKKALEQEGKTLISAHPAAEDGSWYSQDIELFASLSTEDRIIFARNMSAMLDAGLSVTRALGVMQRQASSDYFEGVLKKIESQIRTGDSLTQALKDSEADFAPLFIYMVKAGEESGSLGEALATVANQIERTHELKKKIRGAMMYPSIILVAMVIIGILLMIYIVPSLTETFEKMDADLPATTQFVIAVSDFLANYTIVAVGSMIAAVAGFYFALQTKVGKRAFDWTVLKIPIIGELVKETNSARTAGTLASLLSSGVAVPRSIDITRDVVQHTHYKEILTELKEKITQGGKMADVFADYEYYYPPFVGEMVAVGEETGKIGEMLDRVSSYYRKDVKQKTDDMSTIVEPFLMIVIGAAVGFFAVSMITPIYSLTSSF